METFDLVRYKDVSGVSGEGTIAEGTLWWDGSTTIKWFGDYPVTGDYPSLDAVLAIHGHDGLTKVIFHEQQPKPGRHGSAYEGGGKPPSNARGSRGRSGPVSINVQDTRRRLQG